MAIKKTLLEIVQEILNDLDSDEVNSIDDSVEAQQVASIVESTFYNLIASNDIPEHKELIKLTALSDTDYPTHFSLGSNVKSFDILWYDTSSDSSKKYVEMVWCDPLEFLYRTDAVESNYTTVLDKNGGTSIRIVNNKQPEYYTSFDDEYVILDSHSSTVDTTLQQSKIRAYGSVYPVFSRTDTYIPDVDNVLFPLLTNESKSMAFDILKGGVSQKVEQAARRQKAYTMNDKFRTKQPNNWSNYGR